MAPGAPFEDECHSPRQAAEASGSRTAQEEFVAAMANPFLTGHAHDAAAPPPLRDEGPPAVTGDNPPAQGGGPSPAPPDPRPAPVVNANAPEPMESVRHESTVRFPPGFRTSASGLPAVKEPDFAVNARQALKLLPFSNQGTEDIRLWLHAIQFKFNVPGDINHYAHLDRDEDFNAPLCHVTLGLLQGEPAKWCSSLPPDMIVCFRKLYMLLIDKFARPVVSISERRKKSRAAISALAQGDMSITAYILQAKDIRYQCADDQLEGLKEAFIDGLSDKDAYCVVLAARLRETAEGEHIDDVFADTIKYMRDKFRPDEAKVKSTTAPTASATAAQPGSAAFNEDALVRKVVREMTKQISTFSFGGNRAFQQGSQGYGPQAQDARQPQRQSQDSPAQKALAYQPQPRSQPNNYEDGQTGYTPDVGNMRCWRCCFKGHLTRDCPNPPAPREHRESARAESLARKEYRDSLREGTMAPRVITAPTPTAARPQAAVNNVSEQQVTPRYTSWKAYDDAQAAAQGGEVANANATVMMDWTAYDEPQGAEVNNIGWSFFGATSKTPKRSGWGQQTQEHSDYNPNVNTVSVVYDGADMCTAAVQDSSRSSIDANSVGADLPLASLTPTEEEEPAHVREFAQKCSYDVWMDINGGRGKPNMTYTALAQLSPEIRRQLQEGVATRPKAVVKAVTSVAHSPAVLPQVFKEVQGVLRAMARVAAHSDEVGRAIAEGDKEGLVHHAMLRQRTQIPLLMVHGVIRPQGGSDEWEISSVLIDSGGQINMINERVVHRLQLLKILEPGFAVTAFDGRRSAAAHYVTLPLRIAGVERLVEFYLVTGNTTYQLLLGMEWLTSVHCVVNFGNRDMFIWGKTGRPRQIPEQDHEPRLHSLELIQPHVVKPAVDTPPSLTKAVHVENKLLCLSELLQKYALTPSDIGYEDDRDVVISFSTESEAESGKECGVLAQRS